LSEEAYLTPKKQFEKTLTIPSLCPHASRYHSPRSVRELARKVAEAEGMTEQVVAALRLIERD
jgi:hypothetical protein